MAWPIPENLIRGGALALAFSAAHASFAQSADFRSKDIVGRLTTNRFYTPVNQILTPAGRQLELPGLRPQALALSPDGKLLVTAGKTHELIVVAAASGEILDRVADVERVADRLGAWYTPLRANTLPVMQRGRDGTRLIRIFSLFRRRGPGFRVGPFPAACVCQRG